MNFINISTLNSHVKNMGLEWKWNQKKESNDFTSKGKASINDWLEAKIAQEKEEAARLHQKRDKTMDTIQAKIYSGKKLTAEEKKYLQEKDPKTYEKLKANEIEQKNYEEALKKCKTKEDVERLKMSHMSTSFSAVNSIMHDPHIPEGEKLKLVLAEHQKVKALESSTQEFIESGRYHKLPTEAEQRKAEKDLEEAEQTEREETQEAEAIETKTPSQAAEEMKKQDLDKNGVSGPVSPDGDDKSEMTRTEAEQTPEAKKVRRAKAQKAYWQSSTNAADPVVTAVVRQIEIKA
ncbi:hypothetical protein D3Z38_04130 [Clostridiales bacterium]|nr:hypothetical protein [Clostridiales bacterium]